MIDRLIKLVKKQQPFVAYRKPNVEDIILRVQNDDTLFTTSDLNVSGFVFAPFDINKEAIVFPEEFTNVEAFDGFCDHELSLKYRNTLVKSEDTSDKYMRMVSTAIEALSRDAFVKVVLSRKEVVFLQDADFSLLFIRLLEKYPDAYVYIWYHPKVGMWLGASPEKLLSVVDNNFSTMSLAGTQVFDPNNAVVWGAKEIEEQKIVTDYIVSIISDLVDNLKVEPLETVRAGDLLHLRTVFSGKFTGNVVKLLKALHPTPAVCGMPKDRAMDFILNNEPYDRNFYTGFLGEINIIDKNSLKTDLYVNLRCMEFNGQEVSIYIGGGITPESNPLKEYQETVNKSSTMKAVL